MPRRLFCGPSVVAVCLAVTLISDFTLSLPAQALAFAVKKRRQFVPGQRAIVVDDRLAALRVRPDVKAPLVQRLRYGRQVGIIGPARASRDGMRFFPVAVTRNTRGWLPAGAVIRPHQSSDAARLSKLMDETEDIFLRARLARLCADEFRGMSVAPRALLVLGTAAEQAAERLSRAARRRVGDAAEEGSDSLNRREYALNYAGLDRYNRISVTFDYDQTLGRFVYDGAAYRELLRKYPRSAEAAEARVRLEELQRLPVGKR